jgi:peroxiredoxin
MAFRWVSAVALGALVAMLASRAVAEGVKVGDAAPKWENIPGIDDKKHGLDDYKDAKAIVLVFTCNHCPVAVAYEDRLVELAKDYKDKQVQVIACNVNNLPQDKLDKMKVRATEKGFTFPYLYDESQKMGRDYGARVTPHVFLLDQNRKIAYLGALDDNNNPKQVKTKYLRAAVDALLDGKEPSKAETVARGCGIKYDDK